MSTLDQQIFGRFARRQRGLEPVRSLADATPGAALVVLVLGWPCRLSRSRALASLLGRLGMDPSVRLFLCARCRAQVVLCSGIT